ncbi:hypothetical protein ABFX02_04G113000 [Erythranthe guttata]
MMAGLIKLIVILVTILAISGTQARKFPDNYADDIHALTKAMNGIKSIEKMVSHILVSSIQITKFFCHKSKSLREWLIGVSNVGRPPLPPPPPPRPPPGPRPVSYIGWKSHQKSTPEPE